MQRRPQLSPHKFREVNYDSKTQIAPKEDTSKPLNETGIFRVQKHCGCTSMDRPCNDQQALVALSAIGSQQASAMEDTNIEIHQLLDYCATDPDYGILYQFSNMIVARHSDAGFNNETRAQSRAGSYIFFF